MTHCSPTVLLAEASHGQQRFTPVKVDQLGRVWLPPGQWQVTYSPGDLLAMFLEADPIIVEHQRRQACVALIASNRVDSTLSQ